MQATWNESKRRANLEKHRIDFEQVYHFEYTSCLVRADTRFDYGEVRLVAFGLIRGWLRVLVFTVEHRNLHVISLRKANSKEFDTYEREA